MNEQQKELIEKNKKEIEETRRIIRDFASKGLYSANCTEVKFLYRSLRQLEGREIIEDDSRKYEPVFIDGSDVPISGRYE